MNYLSSHSQNRSVCVIVYAGLHININNLGGNDFFNFLVFAAIEFPAFLIGDYTRKRIIKFRG